VAGSEPLTPAQGPNLGRDPNSVPASLSIEASLASVGVAVEIVVTINRAVSTFFSIIYLILNEKV
jgi:hypothetical protein